MVASARLSGCSAAAHFADIDRLRRAQGNQIAAAEIDAEVLFAAKIKRRRAGNDERERAHAGEKAFAEEVNILRRNQVHHRNLFHATGIDEANSKMLRPTMSAVKSDARIPSVSEMAKPLTGPLAFQNKMTAVINVVTLASKIELNAFS